MFAGQTFLIACDAGGYSPTVGWHGKKGAVAEVPRTRANRVEAADGTDRDIPSVSGTWRSIAVHTEQGSRQLDAILEGLAKDLPVEALRLAVRWHDRGKAHAAFLAKLNPEAQQCAEAQKVLSQDGGIAKAPDACWRGRLGPSPDGTWRMADGDTSAMSWLRPWPYSRRPLSLFPNTSAIWSRISSRPTTARFACRSGRCPTSFAPQAAMFGLPAASGKGTSCRRPRWSLLSSPPQVTLSLEPMELGFSDADEPSWAERMLALRNDQQLGPFRLAYLEAVLRRLIDGPVRWLRFKGVRSCLNCAQSLCQLAPRNRWRST